MPVTHGVASSSLVQTANRVDELISSALFCYIEYLDSLDRVNTRRQYKYLLNRFIPLLPIDSTWYSLSYTDLEKAIYRLRLEGVKDSSISVMIRALKSLWNRQYKKGLAPCPPRFDFKLKTGAIPEYLSRKDLKKLLEIKGKYESVDVWLLLYFFRGMNFKDLALLKAHQIVQGRVYYYRSKTGKEVPNFKVHEVAQDIIDRYNCKETCYIMPYVNDWDAGLSTHKLIVVSC